MYVIYNEINGVILKISPLIDKLLTGTNYINVDIMQVNNILQGRESVYSYNVVFDEHAQDFQLKFIENDSDNECNINDVIYEVNESNCMADVIIIQNFVENYWQIRLSSEVIEKIKNLSNNKLQNIHLSLTEKNNPNILYKELIIDSAYILEHQTYSIPFSDEFEFNNTPISIYTVKKYNSYTFIKIYNT